MPQVLLILSYAFSVWMIVDAYRRGASHFWYLIIFFPFGEWIYFFMVKRHDYQWSNLLFRPGSDLKCATCRYCGALYENRAKCCYGKAPLMKTRVHIDYCVDYQPNRRR